MFISCDEANHNCDKSQYKEASFFERFKLAVHLIFCRACRKYSSRNGQLTHLIKDANVECLETSEKNKLKEEFNKALNKQN